MRYQDRVIEMTRQAGEDLFRTVRAMPADKLSWKPLEMGRSALELLQECAQQPAAVTRLLNPAGMPQPDPDLRARLRQERARWTTIEACEAAYQKNLDAAIDVIRSLPDERIDESVPLPFRPGMTWKVADVILAPYWQLVYHTGQVNYIQTLYGDRELH